jgi:hypothetical protein
MARASSCHIKVVIGTGGAPALSHLGEGMPEPPPSLEVVWNSLVEPSVMACRENGGSLQVEPMKAVPESLSWEIGSGR